LPTPRTTWGASTRRAPTASSTWRDVIATFKARRQIARGGKCPDLATARADRDLAVGHDFDGARFKDLVGGDLVSKELVVVILVGGLGGGFLLLSEEAGGSEEGK